ncbi:MAG: response regulator transcription factor [Gammaproteobacteria bacterium]|nr:response regulator transcription factor [Gammaproteobacteria bacterium]
MNTKKVLIADDHMIFREGLKQVIARTVDLSVADEVGNGLDVLRKVRENSYDVVILDISMPGKNGLEVLADIKQINPKLPVLILSMYPEEQFALRALKCGASGYLTKGSSSKEILDALHRVVMGKRYISPSLAEALADGLGVDSDRPLHETLSAREYQVALMISAGKKPVQISAELAMGVKTVGTYRTRIFRKMNIKSSAELARYAAEHNLV